VEVLRVSRSASREFSNPTERRPANQSCHAFRLRPESGKDPRKVPPLTGVLNMAKIVKVIEVLAQSGTSWEDAAKNALSEAKKTLRNIRSIYAKDFEAKVENGEITEFPH
jgi:flavin-binding protein dodecin